MTILEAFKKIKEKKLDFTDFEDYIARAHEGSIIILGRRVKELKEYLLEIKEIAKKINCAQKKVGCTPIKFVVIIALEYYYKRIYIGKTDRGTIFIELELRSRTFYELKDDKLFKHWYEIIEKMGKFEYTGRKEDYDFFIFTINKIIDFLNEMELYLKDLQKKLRKK